MALLQKLPTKLIPRKLTRLRYKSLVLIETFDRPAYAYALFQAAMQACALNHDKISIIEFGVAGGNGIVALEEYADAITRFTGMEFEIYGFDTATGLPELQGYKDIMHQWQSGFFPMDFDKLQSKLKKAKLVIGNVTDTIKDFYTKYSPAPVGAIMFDVDLYSSTKASLQIFNTNSENLLPRVRCYFDDVSGNEISLSNEYMGEKLAISEYNTQSADRKITPVYHLQAKSRRKKWYPRSFVHHMYDHPRYCEFIAKPMQDSPLS